MTTLKGERTTTINIRGSRRSRIESPLCRRRHQRYFTTSDTNNSIPRRVRSVNDHHYLVVVDVGSNNQPLTRKEEVDNNTSRCYNSGLHR